MSLTLTTLKFWTEFLIIRLFVFISHMIKLWKNPIYVLDPKLKHCFSFFCVFISHWFSTEWFCHCCTGFVTPCCFSRCISIISSAPVMTLVVEQLILMWKVVCIVIKEVLFGLFAVCDSFFSCRSKVVHFCNLKKGIYSEYFTPTQSIVWIL